MLKTIGIIMVTLLITVVKLPSTAFAGEEKPSVSEAEETEAEEADYIEETQKNSEEEPEEEKAGDEEEFVFTGGLGSTVVEKYECLGIRYEIHKECAEITGILNENAVFQPPMGFQRRMSPKKKGK